jgi:hypothetical protein
MNECAHCNHVHARLRTAQQVNGDGETRTVHFLACGKCDCMSWLVDELVQSQKS